MADEDKEGLEYIEKLTSTRLVTSFYALADDTDHRWQQALERFLQTRSVRTACNR